MDERDAVVVAKARDGDREAFRALVDRHSRYIFSLAHRMGNAQDAEDVVQEAWLKAHKQLSRFEARAGVRTWLHRITVNCSIDLIRGRLLPLAARARRLPRDAVLPGRARVNGPTDETA